MSGFLVLVRSVRVVTGELLALCTSLHIIEDKGWKNVVVHLDSQQAISQIQDSKIKDANLLVIDPSLSTVHNARTK